jgi:hypothetical protein
LNKSDEALLEKFREKINQRWGKGIIGLGRQFKIFDDNNSKTLEFSEFLKHAKTLKLILTKTKSKFYLTLLTMIILAVLTIMSSLEK